MFATRTNSRGVSRLVAFAALALGARAQDLDWVRSPLNGRWYAENRAFSTWSTAESIAQALGGHLVTIRSQAENDWLEQQFFATLTLPNAFHWIGLRQAASVPPQAEPGGGWGWSSGEALTFTSWAALQPDDAGTGQDFARAGSNVLGRAGDWFDEAESLLPGFGANLDWYVPPGTVVYFDTTSASVPLSVIQFAPGSNQVWNVMPVGTLATSGGLVEVDDFVVAAGATLVLQGPNSFQLLATGRVVIEGRIDASGASALDGAYFNVPGVPRPGGVGRAGGGRGGDGNPLGDLAPPSGAPGNGAFGAPGAGGSGGETGWSLAAQEDLRRGGGGGGGRFGPDQLATSGSGTFDQSRIGLDAEPGFDNTLATNGAIHGPGPAHGGAVGASPFVDADPSNDFFGQRFDPASGQVTLGELVRPWAGAGGGGGGNALRLASGSFPGYYNSWNVNSGASGGGGGGGGSMQVLALGPIVFGAAGEISARGGNGGGGANTIFFNRVGGGGGGGSGGHVVLQTSAYLDLRQRTVPIGGPNGSALAIDARGGQGAAGRNNLGGAWVNANGPIETTPLLDACPPGYPASGPNGCLGGVGGAGGDGGPGLIQIHTPNARYGNDPNVADILLPTGTTIAQFVAPRPVGSDWSAGERLLAELGCGFALVEVESDDCDGNGEPDVVELRRDPALDLDGDGVLDPCDDTVRYCEQGTAYLCPGSLDSLGIPSASASFGFELIVTQALGQRSGQLFYGLGATQLPLVSQSLCVATPRARLPVRTTGGSNLACDGTFRVDWNQWRAAHPGELGSPFAAGQVFYAQAWVRGVAGGSATVLTNAYRFTLSP